MSVHLPAIFLLQKIHFEMFEDFTVEQFLNYFTVHDLLRRSDLDQDTVTQVIDFKKEGIDWRCKTRMRSNSNEFLDSPQRSASKRGHPVFAKEIAQENDSDSDTMLSDESEKMSIEGHHTIIVSTVGSQFQILIKVNAESLGIPAQDQNALDHIVQHSLRRVVKAIKLSVWPCFRMPLGGSAISLINISFLFASRNRKEECIETEFLVGLSLIQARKFIQASEKFRSIEQKLLQVPSQSSLLQASLIELIVGESMNQHSQISEKVFAFQRAVDLYAIANQKQPSFEDIKKHFTVCPFTHVKHKRILKQDESYRCLVHLYPQLIELLLANIDSNIEAVRLAVLKTIEYLLDILGCSMGNSIAQILAALIQTYPVNTHAQDQKTNNEEKCRRVFSFFQNDQKDQRLIIEGQNKDRRRDEFEMRVEGRIDKGASFYSFADLNMTGGCQVKDFSVLHQSFIQSSKNYYNHILESMLLLLPSMSSDLLLTIFYEIASKCMFSDTTSSELKVYLLKFADKIIHICRGSILVNHSFLSNVVRMMLPSQVTSGAKKKQENLSIRQDEMVGKLCQTIWQTLKTDLFGNCSVKGQRTILSWVLQQLNSLAEMASPSQQFQTSCMQQLKPADNQRLLVILDLIEHLLEQNQHLNQPQANVKALQRIQLRDPCAPSKLPEDSFQDSHDSFLQNSQANVLSHFQANTQKQRQKALALQFCSLVTPMIFWFNFTVESKERLPYFKIIWRILIRLLDSLPSHKVKTDCICIVIPVLKRIDTFCQTSSPSQEMLQFLSIVMTDFKLTVLPKASKASKVQFFTFLEDFLLNFTKVIPHNLHDEVFQVCELIYELLESQGRISQDHVSHVIDALLHKYTMRSKAHKTLCQTFIKSWVLETSSVQLNQAKAEKSDEQILNPVGSEQPEIGFQDVNEQSLGIKLSFDTFISMCLFDNEPLGDKSSLPQVDQDFIYFEKLSMMLNLVMSFQKEHTALFKRFLNKQEFTEAMSRIFLYPRSQENAVRILEALTSFFMKYAAQHNIYEHPLVQHPPPRLYMETRPPAHFQGQSLVQYRLQNLNSEPSVELLQFINQEEDQLMDNEHRQDQELEEFDDHQLNRGLNHQLSHDFGLIQTSIVNPQPLAQVIERSSRAISNQNLMLHDEISILTRERLVLIKVHSVLIRHQIDENKDSAQTQIIHQPQLNAIRDTSQSLNVLNLLHNLFANLCPIPTFQNIVIHEIVQQYPPISQAQHQGFFPGRQQNQNSIGGSSQGNSYMRLPMQNFPQFQQSDIIPEFESMSLNFETLNHAHMRDINQQNGFAADVECWDLRYIHARTAFLIKSFHFVEQTAMQSSWSSVRALCYSVLANAVKIFDYSKLRPHFQKQLKQLLSPLLHRLLQSKSVEGKAGGLNILGNLCGLSSFKSSELRLRFEKNRLRTVYDSDNGRDYDYEKYALIQREAEIRDQIKANENLHVFRKNTQFVSLAIWQEVFKLQDDWDVSIREAASILVQLCAPPDSVKHFNKMKREHYSLQLNQMLNQQRSGSEPFSINKNASTADGISQANSYSREQLSVSQGVHLQGISHFSNAPRQNFMANTFQSSVQFQDINHFIDDIDGQANNLEDNKESNSNEDLDYSDEICIDLLQEEQLQSGLRIFENGFKPLKSLFASDECDQFKIKAQSNKIFEANQEHNIIDLFEDNMLEEVDSSGILELKDPADFFFEIQKREKNIMQAPAPVDVEDLGIIDLDQQGADDFEELDDDKLPVLKNTYSKKNRPNNSKSVAIGSRSQGGSIKHRTITAEHEQPSLAQVTDANEPISEEDEVFIEEVDGSDYTSQEDVQYLKQKNTRENLRSANSDSRNAKKKQNIRLDDRSQVVSTKVFKKALSVHEAQGDPFDESIEKQIVDSDALRSQLDSQKLANSNFFQSERRIQDECSDNLRRIDLDAVQINTKQPAIKNTLIIQAKKRNETDAQSHQGNLKHKDGLLSEVDGLSDLQKTVLPSESPSSSLLVDSQPVEQFANSCASSQFKRSSSPSLPSQITLDNALEQRQKKQAEQIKAKKQPQQKAKQKIGIQLSKDKPVKKVTPNEKVRVDLAAKASSMLSHQQSILKPINKRQLSQHQKQPSPQFITKSISIGNQIIRPKLNDGQSREGSKLRQSIQRSGEPKKDLLFLKTVTEKEYYRFEEQKNPKQIQSDLSETYSATKAMILDQKKQRKNSFSSEGALDHVCRDRFAVSAEKRKAQPLNKDFGIDLGSVEARAQKVPKSSRNQQTIDNLQVETQTVKLDNRAKKPQRPQGPTVGGKQNQLIQHREKEGRVNKERARILVVADEELDSESDISNDKA